MTGPRGDQDTPALGKPLESPDPSEAAKGPSVLEWRVFWFVTALIICGFGLALGLFDRDPGPKPDEVEGQILLDAIDNLGISFDIDCPDNTNEVDEGQTFACTASRGSRSAQIVVTNTEDGFEWARAPLGALMGKDARKGARDP